MPAETRKIYNLKLPLRLWTACVRHASARNRKVLPWIVETLAEKVGFKLKDDEP